MARLLSPTNSATVLCNSLALVSCTVNEGSIAVEKFVKLTSRRPGRMRAEEIVLASRPNGLCYRRI